MEDLVAKNLFGELTLGDVWESVKEDLAEIEVKVSSEPITRTYLSWSANGRLEVFEDFQGGSDWPADFSFEMKQKVKVVGDHVLFAHKARDLRVCFHRHGRGDLSRFLPSSKETG